MLVLCDKRCSTSLVAAPASGMMRLMLGRELNSTMIDVYGCYIEPIRFCFVYLIFSSYVFNRTVNTIKGFVQVYTILGITKRRHEGCLQLNPYSPTALNSLELLAKL